MKKAFDRWDRKLDEISDKMEEYLEERTSIDQRLTRLEHGARQPRLALEADGHANTKTQKRTEGAAIAVQVMRGNSFTTAKKVQDGPKTSITFGVEAELPDLPCREDVLIKEGATSPKRVFGDVLTKSRWWHNPRFSLSMEMSRLTWDGTAEPVSRDQILRHARRQENIHVPCSADHEQDSQPYPVDPYSAICDDHTYIHT